MLKEHRDHEIESDSFGHAEAIEETSSDEYAGRGACKVCNCSHFQEGNVNEKMCKCCHHWDSHKGG